MRTLRELQHSFAHGMFGADRDITALLLGASGQSGAAGLAIYRNNVLANYRKALRETYPVILRLIGADCFDQAADAYARATPSYSGDLYDFGEHFGNSLAGYPATRDLAYLPDVARLEWIIEAADRAPAAPLDLALGLARLAAVPPQRFADLGFALDPSARLFASPYPVLRIWQVNQLSYDGDQAVQLDSGGATLLIIRRGLAVDIEPLSGAGFSLLSAFSAGLTLGAALERALALDVAFDLDAFLRWHMPAGTFSDFRLAEEPKEGGRG
ncbi:putative DNA-binding domain-containing protein [Undibacterium arcticum]|uniref:HvfC/BufC family peptide modification chaperone n=1 Tax=Undibacterium arcticum TaxID=1762892 RepID=UPI00360F9ECE